MRPPEARQTLSGSIFIIVGALFLFNNMEIIEFTFRDLWPFILLAIGIAIIRQSMFGSKHEGSESDFINLTFILGGGDHKFNSKSLRGGKITAIMGGGKIDLRDADIVEEEVFLDIFTLWGGVEMLVPPGWQINMRLMPILGGAQNKSGPAPNGSAQVRQLTVRGTAIMGGMEIKN
jgi:predicted membrane protein